MRPRPFSSCAALVVVALAGAIIATPAARADVPRASASEVTLVAGVNDPQDPNIAVLEYLPSKITVKTGTTVTWQFPGPEQHSVTFVPPRTDLPLSAVADPTLFEPTPPTGPYDGTTLVNSGVLPPRENTKVATFSMSFAKTGTYKYYSVLQPNMVGTVVVTKNTQDSQSKITKAGNKEKSKYLKAAEKAKKKLMSSSPEKTENSDGTTTWTVQMGGSTGHTDIFEFWPTPVKVKAGDSVTFVNNSSSFQTASFGGSLVPTDPYSADVLQAQPGPSPQTLTAGTYFNTGWLPPKTKQGPTKAERSYTYLVPDAGKYEYVSVLHLPSGMAAEIDAS